MLKKGVVNSDGSVTLEASIILPVILLLMFSMVFFSVYVYHKLVLVDTAVYTAAQRAATWDHIGKNLEDGYQKVMKNDGLYWRVFSDSSGFVSQEGSQVSLEGPQPVREKTSAALTLIKEMLRFEVLKVNQSKITVQYKNSLLRRTVSVDIIEQMMIPVNWLSGLVSPRLAFRAAADVVEPAEFIRLAGLGEKYSAQILESFKNNPTPFSEEESEAGQTRKLIASSGVQYGRQRKVFHYQGCRYISRIKAANLIEFDSVEQAKAGGYDLCLVCAKRQIN